MSINSQLAEMQRAIAALGADDVVTYPRDALEVMAEVLKQNGEHYGIDHALNLSNFLQAAADKLEPGKEHVFNAVELSGLCKDLMMIDNLVKIEQGQK
ncbi:hypothetical protein P7F88_12630 [Vibrio hannami]|uniref:hypothetical protein n=1 Tax=Vibrio hannami TaxID=2717094 RepID=UPI0024107134|nr:hypothetical protein [Vibrio hannami]MDG3086889.1 hypothetical protein [Vibrio hannami]